MLGRFSEESSYRPVPSKFLPGSNSESLTPTGGPTIQSRSDTDHLE